MGKVVIWRRPGGCSGWTLRGETPGAEVLRCARPAGWIKIKTFSRFRPETSVNIDLLLGVFISEEAATLPGTAGLHGRSSHAGGVSYE